MHYMIQGSWLVDGAWETKRLSEDDVDEGVCARAANLPSKTPMANDGNAESLGSHNILGRDIYTHAHAQVGS